MTSTPETIGRDLLPAGRVVRILAGLLLVASAVASAPHAGPLSAVLLGQVALAFLVTAAAYTVAAWALGERLLTCVDPWLAAIVLIAPSTAILFFLPLSATIGYNLYIGVSLVVQAAIRYGGCEVLGIPTLFLRRRYAVYCVFNATDLVERALQDRPGWLKWTLALLVFVVTMVVLALAVTLGDSNGERALYLLFLVVGFLVGKVLSRSAAPART
jgi:hypothetical protein